MAQDARIATGLPGHPKTKKLVRRLGQSAGWNLVCLFLWAAANRSDGDLSGMTDEDIELAAEWDGEDGEFADALASVRFLDGEAGERVIHGWVEHNPWAAGAGMRSAKASWNAIKRHHGVAEANRLVPAYCAASNATSTDVVPTSNAPSPSPSPSPSKNIATVKPVAVDLFPSINPQVVADFKALRKAKHAAITQTAVDGIRREATKAGLTLEAALAMCCERGWAGFKAEWLGGAEVAAAAVPGGGRRKL